MSCLLTVAHRIRTVIDYDRLVSSSRAPRKTTITFVLDCAGQRSHCGDGHAVETNPEGRWRVPRYVFQKWSNARVGELG